MLGYGTTMSMAHPNHEILIIQNFLCYVYSYQPICRQHHPYHHRHLKHSLVLTMYVLSCRSLNQRIMEMESEVDDLRNQQKASASDQDSELDKKYKEHL